MALSLQSFNATTARSLETVNEEYKLDVFYHRIAEESLSSPRGNDFLFWEEKFRCSISLFNDLELIDLSSLYGIFKGKMKWKF